MKCITHLMLLLLNPHIYARYRKNENRKLAEKFPDYRYFIADETDIVEVSTG